MNRDTIAIIGVESLLGGHIARASLKASQGLCLCTSSPLSWDILSGNDGKHITIHESISHSPRRLSQALSGIRRIVICNQDCTPAEAEVVISNLVEALEGREKLRITHIVPLGAALGGSGRVNGTSRGSHAWTHVERMLTNAVDKLPGSIVRTLVTGDLIGPPAYGHGNKEHSAANKIIQDCLEGYTLPHYPLYPTDVRDVASATLHTFYEIQDAPHERYVVATGRPVYPDELARRIQAIYPHFGIYNQTNGWLTGLYAWANGRSSRVDTWRTTTQNQSINSSAARHILAFFPRRMNRSIKEICQHLIHNGHAAPQPVNL